MTSLRRAIRLPEMFVLPGNLAFFLAVSIAPLITMFCLAASLLSLSTESIANFFGGVLPDGVSNLLSPFLSSGLNAGNILFLLIELYIASNGMESLIYVSNTVYGIKNTGYIFRKVKSIFMNFWLLFLFLVVLVIMAFGSFILTKILAFGPLGDFIMNNFQLITITKLIFAFIVIFITIKIIYTLAPDMKIKSAYVNIGTVFATISIMLITSLYSFYVTNIAHYDIVYGSLANIVILMLLIYFISYILVLGIAINNNFYQINKK